MQHKIECLKQQIHGREIDLLQPLIPWPLPINEGKGGSCPLCKDGHDRFHWDYNQGRWLYHCRRCDSGGDIIRLLERYFDINVNEAYDKLLSAVSLPLTSPSPKSTEPLVRKMTNIEKCQNDEVLRLCEQILVRSDTNTQHPYLVKKGLSEFACQQTDKIHQQEGGITVPLGALIVAIYIQGKLSTLEFITAEGKKLNLKGCRKQGGYHIVSAITNDDAAIMITEGYATALSLSKVYPGPIVVAFSAYNLKHVREYLAKRYPSRQFIFAADDDGMDGKQGVGEIEAKKAERVNDLIVIPDFSEKEKSTVTINGKRKYTDWNDYQQLGHDVSEAFESRLLAAISAKEHETPSELTSDSSNTQDTIMPYGFTINEHRLVFEIQNADEKTGKSKVVEICSSLIVKAQTISRTGEHHGLLLEFINTQGKVCQWDMPKHLLATDGAELRTELLKKGMPFMTTNRDDRRRLLKYLSQVQPKHTIETVTQSGWVDDHFALLERVFGSEPEKFKVQLQSLQKGISQTGSLKHWQDNIAGYAIGNPALMFSLAIPFAAPLMKALNVTGGGMHWMGGSTCGKTTMLLCAASVSGSAQCVNSWRTTSCGQESLAYAHNDQVLINDELAQAAPKEVSEIIYMIANGQGKVRGTKTGGTQPLKRWRTFLLSSGEISLEQHLDKDNISMQAGQEVRLASIQVDVGRYGVFDCLHQFKSGSAFADHLAEQCQQQHGTALPAFLQQLTKKLKSLTPEIKATYETYYQGLLPDGAERQVARVLKQFALVATGAVYAAKFGIVPWQEKEILAAVQHMFALWCNSRGHQGNREDSQALIQLQDIVCKHQFNYFINPKTITNVNNFIGYREDDGKGNTILSIPTAGWRLLCKGLDPIATAKLCLQRGWLVETKSKGRLQHKKRINGSQIRCYQLKLEAILNDPLGSSSPVDLRHDTKVILASHQTLSLGANAVCVH